MTLLLGVKPIYISAISRGPCDTHTLYGCVTGDCWLCRASPQDPCSQGTDGLYLISFPLETCPLSSCGSSYFLATSWAFLPCLLNVFWFLTAYLPWPATSLLKSFLPDLLLMLMLNQGSFIKSGNTHFQGRTGSTQHCPYNIPVKETTWWVLTKSTMKCFLPHSNLAKKLFIIWNQNHC